MLNLRTGKYQKLFEITLNDFLGKLTAVKTARVAFPEGLTAKVSRAVYMPRPRVGIHGASRLPN